MQPSLVCAVPLRGCGFEMVRDENGIVCGACGFPSPCGDVVLKLHGDAPLHPRVQEVSVPLRGCGFEIGINMSYEFKKVCVSVPLRGCGFEILPPSGRSGQGTTIVSVPLRGCCYFSFPSQCGGSAERSEAIGALVTNAAFSRQTAFIVHGAPTTDSRSAPCRAGADCCILQGYDESTR